MFLKRGGSRACAKDNEEDLYQIRICISLESMPREHIHAARLDSLRIYRWGHEVLAMCGNHLLTLELINSLVDRSLDVRVDLQAAAIARAVDFHMHDMYEARWWRGYDDDDDGDERGSSGGR